MARVLDSHLASLTHMTLFNATGIGVSGPLPLGLEVLTRLEVFDVSGNALTGALPAGLQEWTALRVFRASTNQLAGPLPESLGTWVALQDFVVGENRFSGSLPASVGNWTELQRAALESNTLSGALPTGVLAWTKLRELRLASNRFSGPLVAGYGAKWTKLVKFEIQENEFSGALEPEIGGWSDLKLFRIDKNAFTGSLPLGAPGVTEKGCACARNWTQTRTVDSATVVFECTTYCCNADQSAANRTCAVVDPACEGQTMGVCTADNGANWPAMTQFRVDNNLLSGPLDTNIRAWTKLQVLDARSNAFTGTFPALQAGDWPELKELSVSLNSIGGAFPAALTNCTKLRRVLLASNRFAGALPSSLAGWEAPEEVDLSDNALSGAFPEFAWGKLEILRAAGNAFTGTCCKPDTNLSAPVLRVFDISTPPDQENSWKTPRNLIRVLTSKRFTEIILRSAALLPKAGKLYKNVFTFGKRT